MPRRAQLLPPNDPATAEVEKILASADAVIRRRLAARNINAMHLTFAVTNDGLAVFRGNVDGENLAKMAADLADIAEQTRSRRLGESEH